jgi:alpha-tubulin suppressor-like RCC1 family protein
MIPRRHALLASLATALLATACGTTLVDANGTDLVPALCGCTAPPGGNPVCRPDGSCDYVCTGDLLKCGGACIACTAPANASPACLPGGACGFTCNAPSRLCPATGGGAATCQVEGDASCGPSCAPCPGPSTGPGRGVCQPGAVAGGGTCALTCDAGYNACGGSCYAATDPLHCGPTCQACTAPANAAPVCASGGCAFACDPGWMRCGDACCRADAVASGADFGCALLDDGRVRCWGANDRGQLGNGNTTASGVPVDVNGLPPAPARAVAVAAGWAHACAVVSPGGNVWCWGDNSTGELGTGASAPFSASPVQVAGITGVATPVSRASAPILSAGGGATTSPSGVFGHTCAVGSGGLACWGANASGQLGDGSTIQSRTPRTVGLPAVTSVAAGGQHTCAVSAGSMRCWGANGAGQLGDGTTSQRTTPVAVSTASFPAGTTPSFAAAGSTSSCAIVGLPSQMFCWGDNGEGQVTASAPPPATQPTPLAPSLGGGFQPTWITTGRAHACGLESGGTTLKCFGANGRSQLTGAPTPVGKNDVVLGAAAGLAATVAAGGDHTCALLADGSVQCWGANERGQTGTGLPDATVSSPAFVSGR